MEVGNSLMTVVMAMEKKGVGGARVQRQLGEGKEGRKENESRGRDESRQVRPHGTERHEARYSISQELSSGDANESRDGARTAANRGTPSDRRSARSVSRPSGRLTG